MDYSKLFGIFFLIISLITFASSTSLNNNNNIHKCSAKESEALLLFKQNLSFINYPNDDCSGFDHPIMMSWNTSTDCCNWDGVYCDDSTGDVIRLDLYCGMLKGTIHPDSSLSNLTHLTSLRLSGNKLNGTLPSWLFTSPSLQYLYLDHNMLSGNVPFESFALPSLQLLDLRHNQLGGQIDVQTFRQLTNLTVLGLSYNNFSGELKLDTLLSSLTNLELLDLSYSGFSVTTKNTNHYVNPGFRFLELASCKLKVFPNSFRAMKQLQYLDLSSNEIHGQIPHWAGEIGEGGDGLGYLNLQSNLIEGPFPPSICNMSLWFLDMSNNRFGGLIPQCFGNILEMGGEYYSFVVAVKGVNLDFPQILVDYTIIDLSNNSFEGEIPDVIGGLNSLIVLNLSHNSLIGPIPRALGNLTEIESLDLSSNQLSGEIPQSLAGINTLEVLNLSQNRLVGRIPDGTQFNTFDEKSFEGNPGLCGLPMTKKCSEHTHKQELESNEEESGFTWEVVMLGYGCGTLLGLVMGYLMLSTRKVKWFNAIADATESLVLKKKKRRHVYIGK